MRAISTGIALIAGLLATPLTAQPILSIGTRVRVWMPDSVLPIGMRDGGGIRVGTVSAMDASVLQLRSDATAPLRLPLATLTRLEVSAGRSSHRTAGAVVGGLLSGAAFVGLACGFTDGSCAVNSGNVGGFLAYYAIGAIPGVFIGRAIGGHLTGEERWREVWRKP
ncbi:MAG: hypothetical protein IPP90_06220 [Gemmatimonadaceae bacterium]|nr:hypothetical protein [Gemmatimonadaceae bacterium]